MLERDEQVRQVREELLKQQRECEEQVTAAVTSRDEVETKLERARARKEELRAEALELEEKLQASERAHGELSAQWRGKSRVIAELEQQVSAMRQSWLDKERKLTEERDKALEAAR